MFKKSKKLMVLLMVMVMVFCAVPVFASDEAANVPIPKLLSVSYDNVSITLLATFDHPVFKGEISETSTIELYDSKYNRIAVGDYFVEGTEVSINLFQELPQNSDFLLIIGNEVLKNVYWENVGVCSLQFTTGEDKIGPRVMQLFSANGNNSIIKGEDLHIAFREQFIPICCDGIIIPEVKNGENHIDFGASVNPEQGLIILSLNPEELQVGLTYDLVIPEGTMKDLNGNLNPRYETQITVIPDEQEPEVSISIRWDNREIFISAYDASKIKEIRNWVNGIEGKTTQDAYASIPLFYNGNGLENEIKISVTDNNGKTKIVELTLPSPSKFYLPF